MPTVELLAPAGNPEALDAALGEGADAVYLGARSFNARLRSTNFAFNQLEAAVDICHKQSKRVYVTVNTVFEQRETDRMWQFLQYLERVGPDGIIVQDLGVAKMASKHFPKLALHASTQMNVASAKGVNVLSRRGFKRAVLARELSLDEVRAVRAGSNLELEVFVHGALCVSESGLCLFSSYLGGKSANRGACTQACRRLYANDAESGYWFSPDDLQLIDYVPDLMEAGVASLKIEGRMKSAEYVGSVVAAYRYMIDNWKLGRERALAKAQSLLQSDFARRKTTYFFFGKLDGDYIKPHQAGGTGHFRSGRCAISACSTRGVSPSWTPTTASPRATPCASTDLTIPSASPPRCARSGRPRTACSSAPTPSGRTSTSARATRSTSCRLKATTRRYKSSLPRDLARYRKFPSRESAPEPERVNVSKAEIAAMPEGIYALVGRTGDLHLLNAARPKKAMLLFNRRNAEVMRKEEKELPFKRDSLVLWLDPWFPESDGEWLASELEYWIGRDQRIFVANNVGHLGLLRGRGLGAGITVIAGPYLYSFNRWAASFLLEEGARLVVPPLEISKQNFQKVAEAAPAGAWMPIVFSYPALFRIRADLAASYDFTTFTDREGSAYELSSSGEGSVVTPMKPFSITDRIPFLQKDGVTRFILDFSSVKLSKPLYKQVMRAAQEGKLLPETGRFNWKEGFWNPEETNGPAYDAKGRERDRGREG